MSAPAVDPVGPESAADQAAPQDADAAAAEPAEGAADGGSDAFPGAGADTAASAGVGGTDDTSEAAVKPPVNLPQAPLASDIPPVRDAMPAANLPESYRVNSPKERLCLDFVTNFSRQFRLLYNNRKPLFVMPINECSVPKFVCTTIRPSLLPYRSLYNHDGASAFVADYLTYEFLENPTDPPVTLPSPTTTLWNQRGNSFDCAVLLCSLLEGAGYDAYCVHGYATREVCFADRSRREVVDNKEPEPEAKKEEAKVNKYKLKPVSRLASEYEKTMRARDVQLEADAKARHDDELEAARREALRPPHDQLGGLRVHCWVLVLRGKRGVPETFFIEPTLGEAVSAKSDDYLGVEAVWNSRNYWVNMQDCTNGVNDIHYDLGDSSAWEYVFPENEHPIVAESEDAPPPPTQVLDLPKSWVDEVEIEPIDFESRCPHGLRTIIELATKTEVFAEYLKPDGMVERVTKFEDAEMTKPQTVISTFAQRRDRLIESMSSFTEAGNREQVDAKFLKGAVSELKHHTYLLAHSDQVSADGRKFLFYNNARVDGLERREDANHQLRESYIKREDFLVKRVVDFQGADSGNLSADKGQGRRGSRQIVPKVNIGVESDDTPAERVVIEMTETYARDMTKPADEDIKEVSFFEDMIMVTYHKDDNRVTAQTREFEKPVETQKQEVMPIQQDEVSTFKVDPDPKKNMRNFENSSILAQLLRMESLCRKAVLASQAETDAILAQLAADKLNPKLVLSFYDTTRNAESKARRERIEQEAKAEAARRELMERDYLAPFLTQQIEPTIVTDDMGSNVDSMVQRSRFVSEWKTQQSGWSAELLEMFNIEVELFMRDSAFSEADKEDLRKARKRARAHDIKKKCLEDLQQRLERQALLVQEWYESESRALADRKDDYEKNQQTMKPEEKEEYANFTEEVLFRLKILDQRLARHKEEASKKYVKLDHTLRNDKRLAEFLV